MNSKLRNTLIIAATIFNAPITISAFVQPATNSNTDQCKAINTIFDTDILKNNEITRTIATSTCLLNHKKSQHDSLTDADSEISEFLGSSATSNRSSRSRSDGLPLLLADISEEQREYELKLGKALDTLRTDYPQMLTKNPDFSIYDSNIEVVDPKGITIHGLSSYKTSFQFLHMIVKIFYCSDDSALTFRLVYDCARKNIRVSWNAVLVPRTIYGGVRNRLHVDGISVYELDYESGLISQHRVEHLLINDAPVEAPQGIFSAIAGEAMLGMQGRDPESVPVWNVGGGVDASSAKPSNILEFSSGNELQNLLSLLSQSQNINKYDARATSTTTTSNTITTSSLFSSTDAAASDGSDFKHPLFDQAEFDLKNASRKKFGVPPLTPEQYVQIQAEVKVMETAQRQKASSLQSAAESAELAKQKEKGSLLSKMFGNLMKNTCESNYDCERPEVCCDLGFKKMCCSSGMKVFDMPPMQGRLEKIPMKVIADDHTYPRGGPDGMDNYY
mmetsp:Transcript_9541/g.10525  ORF Transcript_9541/g.10525 Transcript_9541/m.10525 type:complete len:503 (-) Transcript_9541:104-1612(-)